MNPVGKRFLMIAVVGLLALAAPPARAQQFNSDNYLSKPHGVATIIWTMGERNSMWMTTLSLYPRWEFTAAAYVYYNEDDPRLSDGYSTSYYTKYMVFENKAQTGGVALKAGTGLEPGYLTPEVGLQDAFKTFWMNAPVTFPLFNNVVSWDVMPGFSVTREFGDNNTVVSAFTYATRLAVYPFSPKWALAAEIYGSEGQTSAKPEYRAGLRWEPNVHAVLALTYDDELDGSLGGGFEFGVMLFTPPFVKLGGSK